MSDESFRIEMEAPEVAALTLALSKAITFLIQGYAFDTDTRMTLGRNRTFIAQLDPIAKKLGVVLPSQTLARLIAVDQSGRARSVTEISHLIASTGHALTLILSAALNPWVANAVRKTRAIVSAEALEEVDRITAAYPKRSG